MCAMEAKETAHQLAALSAFAENPGLISNIHMTVDSHF